MITDPDLAAAVDGHAHWQPTGRGALYEPPGSPISVLVHRVARPVRREVYMASVRRNGVMDHTVPCYSAAEVVRVAERLGPPQLAPDPP